MNNTNQYRLQNKVTGVQAGSLMHFDTAMPVLDYLKMLATMDVDTMYNPRSQNLRGAQIVSIIETLDADPGQFYSGNKGIRIACADILSGPSGDWLVGPLHIYDGAHTTLALVAFTLAHLGRIVPPKTNLSAALTSLKEVYTDGLLLASNLPDDFVLDCQVPVRLTCPSSAAAKSDGSYDTAIRISAKSTNTSVAVSKQGLFFSSAAGACVLKRVNVAKTITHRDTGRDESSLSSDIIVRLTALLISMLPNANTGVTYGKKRFIRVAGNSAWHSVVTMTAYIQNVLDYPGLIDHNTLEVHDKNISSLLDLLPDLMRGSDILYNVFERLFNNPRGKYVSPKLIGGGAGAQTTRRFRRAISGLHATRKMQFQTDCCKFGLVAPTASSEGVTCTMVAPVLCAMRELIDYDPVKGFYWVITPEKVLTEHVDLLAALLNQYSKTISPYLTKASHLRHIYETKEHSEIAERAFGRIKELVQMSMI